MKRFYTSLLSLLMILPAVSSFTVQADTLTVADGTDKTDRLPVYAYWMDRNQRFQFIYPEADLTAMVGKSIKSMTFYMVDIQRKAWTSPSLKLSLGTSETAGFSSAAYSDASVLTVATLNINMAVSSEPCEWTVTFDTPYLYTGGNLLVDIASDKGSAPKINFYCKTMDYDAGVTSSSSRALVKVLPKCTFEYAEAAGSSASVSVDKIDFPLSFVGETASSTFIIKNMGSDVVSGTITVDPSTPFTVNPSTISEIAAGDSQEVTVTFTPETTGTSQAELTVDLGSAGKFAIALTGQSINAPSAYREYFDAANYASALPQGWTAYATEYTVSTGAINDFTTDYSSFPTAFRFSSITSEGSKGIAWNHVNWAPNSDLYRRYYYLISPEVSGKVVIRSIFTDLPATGAFIEAYAATPNDDGSFTLSDAPVQITWDTDLTNTSWSVGTINLSKATRLAFFMKYGAIDLFAAEESYSSIAGIGSDNTSAPVEYYNLQGMRIDNPAAGQIVIRRQGNKARKVLIRR